MSLKLQSRKSEDLTPVELPKDFLSSFHSVILEAFKDHLKGDTFKIHSNVYPEELVLARSLQQGGSIRCTTAYASLDFKVGKDTNLEKKLHMMVDFFGSFFHDFFSNDRYFSLEDIWSEFQVEQVLMYVKINRDNIELEAEALNLLKK